MYTRSYDDKMGIVIPESYGGTLLREESVPTSQGDRNIEHKEEAHGKNPWEKDEVHSEASEKSEPTFSFLPNLNIKGMFSNIFKDKNFSLQNIIKGIGTEEILIIATAAFLLFSKDGDKECAIMLLLLLFLT